MKIIQTSQFQHALLRQATFGKESLNQQDIQRWVDYIVGQGIRTMQQAEGILREMPLMIRRQVQEELKKRMLIPLKPQIRPPAAAAPAA